ncbi:sister chromatid cohesion and DNA repair protein [Dothidotthia symphoricarpi CBS 119687]|uniref:Sister chromatid cohesion and DNA repair protein n=1 Tax=Dothidotthia symphoricarpi CBS 119687 TaxID=1392245 RepID=A0A6A6A3I3_9PLEO|nr:sister chromatid cohesion and DNA repair protein [Dothidotthia symphoricarpi CBS 119687]KAF2126116.1 sister chromatid cohesion and DNA repair protein [Dothidotthia symphoricarpi CBS 119687]
MAPRSRRSAAAAVTEVVEEEEQEQEEEEQDGLKKLRFKQSLVGRPGKQISVADVLTRLKTLLDELRTIDQEEAHRESLAPIAQELSHQSLLQHKDAGVRAWTACCVVDMLKLFAPDAPYPASKLKEIFSVIIVKMLPLLADPSHPYNSQHMYVLRSLAEWKSILLINEIPGSDQLTSALFTTCFDVLSGPSKSDNGEELSKNVEHNMTEVLSTVIDEAPAVTHDVVDVVVAQFLWADPITLGSSAKGKKNAPIDAKQSTLRRKEAPPAYNMAKNICNAYPEKMARLIGNYFSSVIVDFTNAGTSFKNQTRHRAGSADSEDEVSKGPSEDDINEANKAHRLLRELWKCCPGVLQEIIPHLQDELGTENVQLRQLATETFGDMISGIGAAGPPPLPEMNPVAYPSQSLGRSEAAKSFDFLTTPASINSFPTQHPVAYHAFLQRKNDKSAVIRASWTTGVGRILMTSAGGIGLDPEEEKKLLKHFAECLIDSDEKVRLAAVQAVERFDFNDIVRKLGSNGSMSEPGSILSNLADRVKDKKSVIHSESMRLLGRIWGVAAGAIAEGDDTVKTLLGPIPSRILEACYVNDLEINVQVDLVLYESLLPLAYPPMKPKAVASGASQVVKDSQANGDQGYTEAELDKIRAERQLVLVHGLEEKAKKVFFAKQSNQVSMSTFMEHFLKFCEEYNGGVTDDEERDTKKKLEGLINYWAKTLPNSARVMDDLWKFAKAHDRRAYTLIRFCMDPTSDYRRVFRSIKELRKRIEDGPGLSMLETLNPLLYRVSLLCYNKSHVSAIIDYTRSDDKGLGTTAHELLNAISTKHPKVFSTHVKDLCRTLENESPTAKTPNPLGAVDDLKACAAFAKKFPTDIPMNGKESRKLVQSFLNFALYGTPPQAAKHAITIIMNSDNKKEMHAKEILTKSIKNFEYGGDHWLTKLAALSQLVLLAQPECEDDMDSIVEIAIQKILQKPHSTTANADEAWADLPDDDIQGRAWAVKILVNRLRSLPIESNIDEAATDTYALLNRLVKENGEGSDDDSTPADHKNRQRLLAANSLLKLSCNPRLEKLLKPAQFNQLALVTHDLCFQVRKGFADKLMKYLGQNRLPTRFYAILFFLAYEPERTEKIGFETWIRSRQAAKALQKDTTLELIFPRLLSLLAHHPDFDTEDETLKLMSEYILFYLKCVATKDNISLIHHAAQRVKSVADGIEPSPQADKNLYVLSSLSDALITAWTEQNGWSSETWPGKTGLPSGIFRPLKSHDQAQEIADKQWIDDGLIDELEPLVRKAIRSKKRRATDGDEKKSRKKARSEKTKRVKGERPIKTPRKKRRADNDDDESDGDGRARPSSEPRRKSGRQSTAHKSYIEVSSGEEDAQVGAEEPEEEEEEEAETSEANEQSSPAPEEDVEMADEETVVVDVPTTEPEGDAEAEAEESDLSDPEASPEPSPEPEPPKKTTRGKSAKTTNGAKSSPVAQKRKAETTLPARPAKTTAKSKAKANETATPSSPVANGTRRSARTKG